MAAVVNEASREQFRSHPARKVRAADVQHEIDAIWRDGQQALGAGQIVTRACMSNLIIYCDDDTQSADVEASLPGIVLPHPSRVILLTGHGKTADPGIEVFVSGHYRVLPGGWQVCAEQIRVVADGQAAPRLPSVARSHRLGNLPTTLWWASRQPPPFADKLFFQLATLSDQIIYDSFGWTEPTKGMQAMSRWLAAERTEYVVDNLAWRRLKPWRSLISQVLDPAVLPDALSQVSRLEITHGPHAVTMAALLVGWLAALLRWEVRGGRVVAGKRTVWQFGSGKRQFPVELTRVDTPPTAPHEVHWVWRDGERERHMILRELPDDRFGIAEQPGAPPVRVISAPQPDRGAMVAAQMAHRARDAVFEQAMETGNAMTTVLLQ